MIVYSVFGFELEDFEEHKLDRKMLDLLVRFR